MIWLASAFLLGLAGSVHCAAMCGPLMIALPRPKHGSLLTSRFIYHAGRLTSYAMLGVALAALGKTLALAGIQRWVSIAAGVAVLASIGTSFILRIPALQAWTWLRTSFGLLLRHPSLASTFCLGALNGLLPCGLVYVAATGALASGSFVAGVSYMVAFGSGTLPILFGLSIVGRKFPLPAAAAKLIPISISLVGLLLVLRGLDLGIPYLSPSFSTGISCH